ncbi:MAG: hypothetical protein E4H01_04425 [Lysobacterales bacterium]|nr:MAG: hypothetical protein E4H01_04425 [Xanthomonadales bacterium]
MIGGCLDEQRARGRRYLIGDGLSAVDIYWATSCGILDPMSEDRCPMATAFRGTVYGNRNPAIAAVLTPALRAHRNFIYDTHLRLPIVF